MDTDKQETVKSQANGVESGATQYQPSTTEIVGEVIAAFQAKGKLPSALPNTMPAHPDELPLWAKLLVNYAARKVPAWALLVISGFGGVAVVLSAWLAALWHMPARMDSMEIQMHEIACAVGVKSATNCEAPTAVYSSSSRPTKQ